MTHDHTSIKNSMATEYDVVVVGAGGAGLAAAISAAELGASVALLERLPDALGTTSKSVGSFAAANTRVQQKAGVVDQAAEFAEDMALAHPKAVNAPELRTMYAERSGEVVDWLEDMGVAFVGPYPEPPNRVPRMHNAVPNGKAYVQTMVSRAKQLPIDILFGASVSRLTCNDNKVSGVSYVHNGQTRMLRARAVVMAAGDYSGSPEMRERYLPAAGAAAVPINPNSLGLGHLALEEIGADFKQMDMAFGPQLRFSAPQKDSWINQLPSWRWFRKLASRIVSLAPRWAIAPIVRELLVSNMSPVPAMFEQGAHLIDLQGNDLGHEANAVEQLALSPKATGYVLGSAELARKFNAFPNYVSTAPGIAFAYFKDYEAGRPDLVHRADNLELLSKKLGLQPELMSERYPELKGKAVFALGPLQAMLTVTEGGAAIDPACRVLRHDKTAFSGLYAAGGNGQGGLVLKGHGLHIGWAITSGRVAGQNAAAYAKTAT